VSRHRGTLGRWHRGRLDTRHRGTRRRRHGARVGGLIITRRDQDGLIVLGGVPHLRILEILEILVSRHRGTLGRWHRGRLDTRHRGTLRRRHRARVGRLIIPRRDQDGLIVLGGVPHLRILEILEILVSRHRGILETTGRNHLEILGSRHHAARMCFIVCYERPRPSFRPVHQNTVPWCQFRHLAPSPPMQPVRFGSSKWSFFAQRKGGCGSSG
jgi:hypothetical protein